MPTEALFNPILITCSDPYLMCHLRLPCALLNYTKITATWFLSVLFLCGMGEGVVGTTARYLKDSHRDPFPKTTMTVTVNMICLVVPV